MCTRTRSNRAGPFRQQRRGIIKGEVMDKEGWILLAVLVLTSIAYGLVLESGA